MGYFVVALLLVIAVLPSVLRQEPPAQNQTAQLSPDTPPDPDQQSIISSFTRGQSGTATDGLVHVEPTGGDSAPVTLQTSKPIPTTRRCFGNPPRQTEDPQSPPCVPGWRGDNGGATSKGVTATEIRIAMPAWDEFIAATLENYFNARYEFYGRRLRILEGYDTALGNENPAAAMPLTPPPSTSSCTLLAR